MHDNVFEADGRGGERVPKPVDALRLDGDLVAVVFGNGRENLERAHTGVDGATGGHVNTTGIDGVGAEIVFQASVPK